MPKLLKSLIVFTVLALTVAAGMSFAHPAPVIPAPLPIPAAGMEELIGGTNWGCVGAGAGIAISGAAIVLAPATGGASLLVGYGLDFLGGVLIGACM